MRRYMASTQTNLSIRPNIGPILLFLAFAREKLPSLRLRNIATKKLLIFYLGWKIHSRRQNCGSCRKILSHQGQKCPLLTLQIFQLPQTWTNPPRCKNRVIFPLSLKPYTLEWCHPRRSLTGQRLQKYFSAQDNRRQLTHRMRRRHFAENRA